MSGLDRLGKYEIRGVLGRGAMGVVYDGWDPVIDRRVAIKTVELHPAEDEAGREKLERFRREAQAAGRLHHPAIVSVFDYAETDDLAYIVMEFVAGRTLKDVLAGDERLPPARAIQLLTEVLAGLDYSHERGVVHRDIKPANIIIAESGQAKIADFGIARIERSEMTQAGTVMGTPAYMSPEQFMGHVVDRRTDIYSCGVVLYQLLTGERPFEGSLSSIMHKVMTTTPPPPSALAVTAPRELDGVVARAMAVRPEGRYKSAAAFADALRAPPPEATADDATVLARPATPPAPKKASASPLLAFLAAAVLGVAGVSAWMLLGRHAETPQPAPQLATQTAAPPVAPAPPPAIPSAPPEPTTPEPPAPAPAVTPTPEPAPPVTPPPPAPRNPADILPALATALSTIPCSLAQASAGQGGSVSVTGLAGAGDPMAALRRAAGAADPPGLDWQVRGVEGPYCPALDLLRGLGAPNVRLEQVGGPAPLEDNQIIALRVLMPGFAGFLHLAYVQSNATVSPLVPTQDYPSQTYPARAATVFGPPHRNFAGWRVGAPFGADMAIAIATTAPLFTRPLPDELTLPAYLATLRTAIDTLRRRGGAITGTATIIDTKPAITP